MPYEIRAMSFGEILDTGFRLIRDHAFVLIGMACLIHVPQAVVDTAQGILVAASGAANPAAVAASVLSLILLLLAISVVPCAITFAVGEIYLGRPVSIGQSARYVSSILLPLSGTMLLWGLILAGGFLLLGLPWVLGRLVWVPLGVLLFPVMVVVYVRILLRLMFVWQVAVLERVFGTAALRRSRELLSGNLLRAVGIMVVGVLITLPLQWGVRLMLAFAPAATPLVSAVPLAVAMAFTSAVNVVFYFDVRCRKEAFDLDHLGGLVARQAVPELAPGATS